MSCCPSKSCPADVCELLLWKNKQVTGVIFGSGLLFYFALFALNYSLLLLLCRIAQLLIIACVGAKFIGKGFVPQEECVKGTIERLEQRARVTLENIVHRVILPIVDPKDLAYVGKMFAGVTLVGMVASWFCTCVLILLVFVGAFTIPYGYQENKQKIDPLLKQAMDQVNKSFGGILSKVSNAKPKSN